MIIIHNIWGIFIRMVFDIPHYLHIAYIFTHIYRFSRSEEFHKVARLAISCPVWPFVTLHGYFDLTRPFVTLCGYSHLAWTFSPHMAICHLTWPFSSCMAILTSCDHSHLAWAFSSHIAILNLLRHFHLADDFSPLVAILTWRGPHFVHSPPQHQTSCCVHHNTTEQTSHLACMLHASLHMKIIFFTLRGKNSQKDYKATPIPSIRYLYEQPVIAVLFFEDRTLWEFLWRKLVLSTIKPQHRQQIILLVNW